MRQVELIGHRSDLHVALAVLQTDPVAEVVLPGGTDPGTAVDPVLRADLSLVEALLARLPAPRPGPEAAGAPAHPGRERVATPIVNPDDVASVHRRLPALTAGVARWEDADEQLREEDEQLRSTVELLAGLNDLVPQLSSLTDTELTALDLATVVLLLDDPDGRIVDVLRDQLWERLGDRFLLVSTADADPAAPGTTDADPAAPGTAAADTAAADTAAADTVADQGRIGVGCLLVVSRGDLARVEELLGTDRIAHVSVPEPYAGRSLRGTVQAMRERLASLPAEQAEVRRQLQQLVAPHRAALSVLRRKLAADIERQEAAACADLTERTFALRLWVPDSAEPELAGRLSATVPSLVLTRVPWTRTLGRPPVLLRQRRRSWRPYQRLVGFLSWPSPQGVDPSGLMAVFLPFLFGVMVGDIVYGVLLAAGGWWASRRFADRPVLVDAGKILLAGGLWATVFGVLFGEALGSLGNSWGLPALWFYRGGPAALQPLLLFAIALGAAHIVLGLVLGIWSAIRTRQRHLIAERAGTLAVLIGLFALVGALARLLPTGLLTPAVLLMVVGLVVASVSHGALGLLLGPLELLGTLGNILSYLRVAAVGLASVYLANVANELARNAPLVLGLLVAVLLHTLNLALAAFSPTVQALRLHYVEFFSKFHDGGGRAFRPLGAGLPPLPDDLTLPPLPAQSIPAQSIPAQSMPAQSIPAKSIPAAPVPRVGNPSHRKDSSSWNSD